MTNPDDQLATTLENDVRSLCLPEGRMVGTVGHATAEAWVAKRLTEIGGEPYRGDSFALPYQADEQNFTNFAGIIPGTHRDLAPVLIGAHYDSVIEDPCADDNGAAVAITLAVGEAVAQSGGLERDLLVVIFDAEEPPYYLSSAMGSNRFYEDQLDDRGVHFALISDLVGHDVNLPLDLPVGLPAGLDIAGELQPLTFATGAESHPDLPELLTGITIPDRMKLIATLNEYVGDMSDHGIFRRNGVPYLFLSCGHWEHYHRPTDTPDRLNYRKMAAIKEYAEAVCRVAAGSELPEASEAIDPIAFEASTWNTALGPLALPLASLLGVENFETRESVEIAAQTLQRFGL
jgi:hypothetical protein